MAKSDSELKRAIAGLNIKKPYDLRFQGKPSFKLPQNEGPHFVQPQTEGTQFRDPDFEATHLQETQIQAPQLETVPSLEALEVETEKLPKGYFKLAHSTFAHAKLRALTGDAFRVFLWMSSRAWRFETSNGCLRASVSYISILAGVSESSVSRSLALLKREDLIELKELNFKKGNLWKVCSLAYFSSPEPESMSCGETIVPRSEVPQSGHPRIESEAAPVRGYQSPILREQPIQIEGEVRTPKNLPNPSQHSHFGVPIFDPALKTYIASIKAPAKFRSESEALRMLLKSYSESELVDAFRHLCTQGIPGSGERSYSPMAFLTQAIDQVLEQIQIVRTRDRTKAQKQSNAELRAKSQLEREALEEAEFRAKQEAFNRNFPSPEAQDAIISQYKTKLSGVPLSGEALRSIVVSAWAEDELLPALENFVMTTVKPTTLSHDARSNPDLDRGL